jgi:hypothetical protein
MRITLLLASLYAAVTPVNAVHGNDGRLLGKPISPDVEMHLKSVHEERRDAISNNYVSEKEPVPDFRRLSDAAPIISRPQKRRNNRRQLPFYAGTRYMHICHYLTGVFRIIDHCNVALTYQVFFLLLAKMMPLPNPQLNHP